MNQIRKIALIGILIVLLVLVQVDLIAQCPMCRLSAETNLAQGGTEGKGLNKGILYLFSMPYLLVGGLAFLWWKNKRSESDIYGSDTST